MKICFNNMFGDGIGWNFGVSTWIKNTKSSLERIGIKHDPLAKVAVSMGLPRAFVPVTGRYNVFMTLFETEDLFKDDYEKMSQADLIIVPCQHNKRVLERNLPKSIPIHSITGGYDNKIFTYKRRKDPDLFKFLYVGALNPRKGYDIAIEAFERLKKSSINPDRIWLYIKTTSEGKDGIETYSEKKITYDYRVLPTRELNILYHDCHCLLLPSHGEGIGLTAMEAYATGMPVIYTNYGGTVEFLKEGCLAIDYSLVGTDLRYPSGEVTRVTSTKWAEPDMNHLVSLMEKMFYDYDKYVSQIEGGIGIYEFTWKRYAEKISLLLNSGEVKEAVDRKDPPKTIYNLGCGFRKYPGTIGVDSRKEVNPEIIYDLSRIPFRFAKKESCDEILALNILEHFVDIVPMMKEFHRMLKKDGLLHIQVPYYKSPNFFIDPTHHHAFHESSMDFFDRSTYHGSVNNYANIDFRVLQRQVLDTGDIYFILQKSCDGCGKDCLCKTGL